MKSKTILSLLLVAVGMVVQAQIINLGNPESFNTLLKENFSGKTVYIDVMASWCKPCLSELSASKDLDDYFNENNIVRLFVTIDIPEDIETCIKLLNKHSLSGYLVTYHQQEKKLQNTFAKEVGTLFLQDKDGKLAIAIPKYAIADKQGNIIVKNAERPSNPDALRKQFREVQQAQEITEENYQKLDKEIWDTYQVEVDKISAELKLHPEKEDSLMNVFLEIDNLADKRNIEAAIKYAAVPGGLQRLYWVRLDLPKDTVQAIWNTLPMEMKTSTYGKSLQMHLETEQIKEGDMYYEVEATDTSGIPFRLSSLAGKNVILIYDGLGCAHEESLNYLKQLYASTSRKDMEIVAYCLASSLEKLQDYRKKIEFPGIMISDFKMDHTPFKIRYGAQIRPTIFVIDKTGKVILKIIGSKMNDMEKISKVIIE